MSALLTDNLPLLAGAPNGIRKLRELILELAVRGKLVPQDPSDEPASELLKRIAEEKARLVAEGRIRKQKPLAEIGEDEKSFGLPAGWAWQRFADFALDVSTGPFGSLIHQSDYVDGGVPLVNPSHMIDGRIVADQAVSLSTEMAASLASYRLSAGDMVMARRGEVGRVALVTEAEDGWLCGTGSFVLRFTPEVSREYVWTLFRCNSVRTYLAGAAVGTTMVNLNHGILLKMPTAVPSAAEQHRIVAKVDELMALCDRLEARQADAASAHARLVQALLDSLTRASDAEDFAASWQRLAEHFHSLFSSEASIDALKQTLLQLAVMGKLVPQDPSDESASELLKRIAEEKARLVAEEGLRTTARDDVPEDERYLAVPRGWAYCRLGNLARFIDYRGKTPTKTQAGIPLITAKNVRPGFISREPQEFIAAVDYEAWMTRGFPRIGDMLFTTEAPMGNVALIDISEKFALAQRVICLQLHELLIGPFLKLAIMSSAFQKKLLGAATGMTATGIKASRLKEIPVPLPPLAEQQRIVVKLDQLMNLCDQLKARLSAARQLHERLTSTLVEQAVA